MDSKWEMSSLYFIGVLVFEMMLSLLSLSSVAIKVTHMIRLNRECPIRDVIKIHVVKICV